MGFRLSSKNDFLVSEGKRFSVDWAWDRSRLRLNLYEVKWYVFLFIIYFSLFFLSRILALEKLGAVFNQVATPLRYTPRKFVIHPQSNNLIIIESDHNAFTDTVKEEKKQQIAEVWNMC